MKEMTLGIDLGGTKILAAVVDAENRIVARAKKKTKADGGAEAVIKRIVQVGQEAVEEAALEPGMLTCAGIGSPGPLDPWQGIVFEAPNLGWKNVPLKALLEKEFGCPVALANDVNAGTWGEYVLGAGRGSKHCLGVFVGTGIGGGLIFDGKLFHGAANVAGEIGHMVLDPNGPECGCGQRGCVEALASRTAITREIRAAIDSGGKQAPDFKFKNSSGQIRSKELRAAWEEGDKATRKILEQAAAAMGLGLASAANLINPDRIVLGGGVVEAFGGAYTELVCAAFVGRAFKSVSDSAELVEASLGDDAGVLGAALIAREMYVAARA